MVSVQLDFRSKLMKRLRRDMMRIRVELQALSTVTAQIPQEQNSIRDDVLTSLAKHHDSLTQAFEQRINQAVEQRISEVGDMMKVQSEQFQTNQNNQIGPLYRGPPPSYRRRKSSSTSTSSKKSPARAEGVGVRVSQYTSTCRPGCICACHAHRRSNTPSFVDRVLGQMFVGYAGLPVISPKCDGPACEKSQVPTVNVEYWFPLGFCWSQIVKLQLGYRPSVGPQFNLTTFRRVPDTAQCVDFALNGNIEGLKGLFKRGLASPWDVSSTRGYTMVRVSVYVSHHMSPRNMLIVFQWALYGKQYQTVKFLVQAGADADYK
jgi:hypothetical protein